MGITNIEKILIISNYDKIWLLPAWYRVFSKNKDNLSFEKLILVPDKLTSFNKIQSYKYYLTVFGVYNFILLTIFFVLRFINNINIEKKILKHTNIKNIKNFNVEEIRKEIKNVKPDIVFITCSYIIPEELLNIDRNILWINKHASLLPETKGLFPYIWNVINNRNQGVSFHQVTKDIDEGNIFYQKKIEDKKTMVSFYKEIFYSFDKYFHLFYQNKNNAEKLNESGDYYSLPKKIDIKKFKKNN